MASWDELTNDLRMAQRRRPGEQHRGNPEVQRHVRTEAVFVVVMKASCKLYEHMTNPGQHGMFRGTFEAALAEAQGAELHMGGHGTVSNHLESLRGYMNGLRRGVTLIEQALAALGRVESPGWRMTAKAGKGVGGLLQAAREQQEWGRRTETVLERLLRTWPQRLEGAGVETKGRTREALVSSQLQSGLPKFGGRPMDLLPTPLQTHPIQGDLENMPLNHDQVVNQTPKLKINKRMQRRFSS